MFEIDEYLEEQYESSKDYGHQIQMEKESIFKSFSKSFKYYFDIITDSPSFKYLKWRKYKIRSIDYDYYSDVIRNFYIRLRGVQPIIIGTITIIINALLFSNSLPNWLMTILALAIVFGVISIVVIITLEANNETLEDVYEEYGIEGLVELNEVAKQKAYELVKNPEMEQHKLNKIKAERIVFD